MFGEKGNLKSFNDREISEKNYFKGVIIPLNTSTVLCKSNASKKHKFRSLFSRFFFESSHKNSSGNSRRLKL